jgi:hypothetical protein
MTSTLANICDSTFTYLFLRFGLHGLHICECQLLFLIYAEYHLESLPGHAPHWRIIETGSFIARACRFFLFLWRSSFFFFFSNLVSDVPFDPVMILGPDTHACDISLFFPSSHPFMESYFMLFGTPFFFTYLLMCLFPGTRQLDNVCT